MGNQQTIQPTWALITKPSNYPEYPVEGKLESIWQTNYHSLYHRYSPYSDYNPSLIHGFTKQPFLYTYIDESNKGLNAVMKYDSRIFPIGSAPRDIIRVSKFLGSGNGISFVAKQFLLQTSSPYNERRIYNPLSPIIAAGNGLLLGSMRPERSFDTSGGILGIANTLFGNFGKTIGTIFTAPKSNPLPGTTFANTSGGNTSGLTTGNPDVLPSYTLTTGAKGLIRAGTALRAKSHLTAAWSQEQAGTTQTFKGIVKGLVSSLFQTFIPQTQDAKYRSDESAYGLMLSSGNIKFKYNNATGITRNFIQTWVAGGSIMRKSSGGEAYTVSPSKMFVKYDKNGTRTDEIVSTDGGISDSSIPGLSGQVGYSITNGNDTKPGYRYGDSVGSNISDRTGEFYKNSDIMRQYKNYADSSQKFPTKDPDSKNIKTINDSLKRVINQIQQASNGVYSSTYIPSDSAVIRSGDMKYDYDRLFNTNIPNSNPIRYPLGMLSDYKQVRMTDETLKQGSNKSVKLPINGKCDAINTLWVLDKNKEPISKFFGEEKWSPYDDDLVALFFYDVVNEKYIPFRATIKGLAESANASWEELPFIGRADRVYSYGGFTRTLNFSLKILINSIAELMPTWQRINYITTAIKPSNYTTAKLRMDLNEITNRFMIPPMFMLTIGDLYRDQPVLFQSVAFSVPDDASWETLNTDNSNGFNWSYLADMIKAPGILYGQLPREVDLTFTLNLLEKERAIIGGANFGHAPRNDDWSDWNVNTVPNNGEPNEMHKKLVVKVQNNVPIKEAVPIDPLINKLSQQFPIPTVEKLSDVVKPIEPIQPKSNTIISPVIPPSAARIPGFFNFFRR